MAPTSRHFRPPFGLPSIELKLPAYDALFYESELPDPRPFAGDDAIRAFDQDQRGIAEAGLTKHSQAPLLPLKRLAALPTSACGRALWWEVFVVARGVMLMCDYSLHAVAFKPASAGDKLVSTNFQNAITRGFAAVGEPDVAVCLLPGTEVAFDADVKYDNVFGFLPNRTIAHRTARFRKVNLQDQHAHHDALEFPDGTIVLLTRLRAGQHATVLQLPAQQQSAADAERQVEPIGLTLAAWLSVRT